MEFENYRFTFDDFRTDRKLSRCLNAPPIAGYIRWLFLRIQNLVSSNLESGHYHLCSNWWEQIVEDESNLQREANFCPHAIFDLGKGDELNEERFSSDLAPLTFRIWSQHTLQSKKPNPIRARTIHSKGRDRKYRLYLHEMLALIAQSDLSEACQLLIIGSSNLSSYQDQITNTNKAMVLIVGATELVNRAELHKASLSTDENNSHSSSKKTDENNSHSSSKKKEEQANTIEQQGNLLSVTFNGQKELITGVARNGKLTIGYSCLLSLLSRPPHSGVDMLALASNYKNINTGGKYNESKMAAEAGIREGTLRGEESQTKLPPEFNTKYNQLKELKKKINEFDPVLEKRDYETWSSEYEKQIEELYSKLEKSQNVKNARLRQSGDTAKREAIRTVGRALKNAVGRIKNIFPSFGTHLESSIRSYHSETISYSPRPTIKWHIE